MTKIGHHQRQDATERAAALMNQHGGGALDAANLALIEAVRAGDQAEMNLLCEACLILLRTVPTSLSIEPALEALP